VKAEISLVEHRTVDESNRTARGSVNGFNGFNGFSSLATGADQRTTILGVSTNVDGPQRMTLGCLLQQ
jgi:hypothetical protein